MKKNAFFLALVISSNVVASSPNLIEQKIKFSIGFCTGLLMTSSGIYGLIAEIMKDDSKYNQGYNQGFVAGHNAGGRQALDDFSKTLGMTMSWLEDAKKNYKDKDSSDLKLKSDQKSVLRSMLLIVAGLVLTKYSYDRMPSLKS